MPPCAQQNGKVYLIGAGPGDPGLMTLRGTECLGLADIVLYDYLVNPRILSHAREDAERICLGRHGQGRIWAQSEINSRLVELAQQGKRVARLKGGDPAVFARTAEEVEALVQAEISFEVVPGITAALAASSYAGIPLTHRDLSSAVGLVTGHEADASSNSLDYAALAEFPGTLVFYMGVTTASHWTQQLIAAGKAAQTPAAILRNCSLPDQRLVPCTLEEIPAKLAATPKIRPPALVILGDVVKLAPRLSWFSRRPLCGQVVLVTRPRGQAEKMARMLEELGAEVLLQPAIEIRPPDAWEPVDQALQRLSDFEWVVFSSSNAVRFLLGRLAVVGLDMRAFGGVKIACVGPGTSEELQRFHLQPDLMPGRYQAEDLLAELLPAAAQRSFLIPRGSRGRELLADELQAAGAKVEQIVVYQSRDLEHASPELLARMKAGEIDWVTVTSSAIGQSVARMFGADLKTTRLASISPLSSQSLRDAGYEPAVEASEYTMAGLTAEICAAVGRHSS